MSVETRSLMAGVFCHRPARIVAVLLLALGGFATESSAAQETAGFTAATAAFEQGDYLRALALFQAARAQGADGAALHYNIGVCQYRLGDFAEAERSFQVLGERFREFRALADYNRGLALLGLGRDADAAVAFAAARSAGDEQLAALAASALAELAPRAPPPAPRWRSYFDFAVGHDDNVALVDDVSLPTTPASALAEALGYASRRLARAPLRFDFSGYVVRYADAEEFDQESLRIDTAFELGSGPWRLAVGPHAAHTTLDGDGFEQTVGVQFRAARALNQQWAFDVRLLYDDIDAPTARYDFMAGTRERVRFGLEHRGAAGRLGVTYELDSQERADPNVSPERDRLAFGYQRRVNARWSFDGVLAHRTSRYDDSLTPHDERLLEVTAVARRELRGGWLLNAAYRWTDNDADVDEFSYRGRRVTIGLSRSL